MTCTRAYNFQFQLHVCCNYRLVFICLFIHIMFIGINGNLRYNLKIHVKILQFTIEILVHIVYEFKNLWLDNSTWYHHSPSLLCVY